MIKIDELKEEDHGKWVAYNGGFSKPEIGKVKSWNDVYIFVVFHCNEEWDKYFDYTGAVCKPGELTII